MFHIPGIVRVGVFLITLCTASNATTPTTVQTNLSELTAKHNKGDINYGHPYCEFAYKTATNATQNLTSRGYPQTFKNINCQWVITANRPSGYIAFFLENLTIRDTTRFNHGNLTVYSGSTHSGFILATWNGSIHDKFNHVRSYSRTLTIKLRADANVITSFRLSYSQYFVNPGPSLIASLSKNSIAITKEHNRSTKTHWKIITFYTNIKIKLYGSATGHRYTWLTCLEEYLLIYQPRAVPQKLCVHGHDVFVSKSNTIHVEYHSLTLNKLQFPSFEIEYSGGMYSPIVYTDTGGTGCHREEYTASRTVQYITSPNYPHQYGRNLDCRWTIKALPGQLLNLTVMKSDMESALCSYDKVSIYNGPNIYSPLIGVFCGREVISYIPTASKVLVRFQTDDVDQRKGFSMTFRSGNFQVCKPEELVAGIKVKFIASPNYPFRYQGHLYCTWLITTGDSDFVVYVYVYDMNIYCSSDSLKLYDGRHERDPLLENWCGEDVYTYAVSTGMDMFITFRSDGYQRPANKGFLLKYSSRLRSSYFTKTQSMSALVIGLAVSISVVVLVSCIIVCKRRQQQKIRIQMRLRNRLAGAPPYRQTNGSASTLPSIEQQNIYIITGNGQIGGVPNSANGQLHLPTCAMGPPSYNEVLENGANPPSYDSLVLKDSELSANTETFQRTNSVTI